MSFKNTEYAASSDKMVQEHRLATVTKLSEDSLDVQFKMPHNSQMTNDDKEMTKDMVQLFVRSSKDEEYSVEGGNEMFNRPVGFLVSYGEADSDVYTVDIIGVKSVSMRTFKTLQQHGSVYDIVIESNFISDNNSKTESQLTIKIKLFKSHVNFKRMHVWTQDSKVSPDDNTTGLIMDQKSKASAKNLICLVNNMAIEDWEPMWRSHVDPNKTYLLSASHIRRVTYSFYKFLQAKVGENTLLNCVVVSEVVDSVPIMTLMLHCKCNDDDNDNDDNEYEDDIVESAPPPAPVSTNVSSKKGDHHGLHKIKSTNNTIGKYNNNNNNSNNNNNNNNNKKEEKGWLKSVVMKLFQ